ncbi:MAG: hypothetical protein V3U31_08775 [Dehalococcoidia bacterium]
MVAPGQLTEQDLDFVVETVAPQRGDREQVKDIVRDKADFIEVMLEDGRLFRRVMEEEAWVRISPYLLFTVLLRQARKDMHSSGYTLERLGTSHYLPVFDGALVAGLLEDGEVRDYLSDMLISFTRVHSTVVYFRHRGRTQRRSFSDMDMDDMVELSQGVEPEYRFPFFKRIGDIAMFLVGIFPEYVAAASAGAQHRPRLAGRRLRTAQEYQEEGSRFYLMAAECAPPESRVGGLLCKMADNFDLARKPLNLVSERYIPFSRLQWFAPSL